MSDHENIIKRTQTWLDTMVIGLNLCPFAKAVRVKQSIHFAVSDATSSDAALLAIHDSLMHLVNTPEDIIETSLLIFSQGFDNFMSFLDLLDLARQHLSTLNLDGVLQIADFHPNYQFAECDADAVDNYTNRAPFPTLHFLRETSIDRAVAAFPDAANIYERNIALLQSMGLAAVQTLNNT